MSLGIAPSRLSELSSYLKKGDRNNIITFFHRHPNITIWPLSVVSDVAKKYHDDAGVIGPLLDFCTRLSEFGYKSIITELTRVNLSFGTPKDYQVIELVLTHCEKNFEQLQYVHNQILYNVVRSKNVTVEIFDRLFKIRNNLGHVYYIVFSSGKDVNIDVARYCLTLNANRGNLRFGPFGAFSTTELDYYVRVLSSESEPNIALIALLVDNGVPIKHVSLWVQKLVSPQCRLDTLVIGLNDKRSSLFRHFNGALGERQLLKTIVNMAGM